MTVISLGAWVFFAHHLYLDENLCHPPGLWSPGPASESFIRDSPLPLPSPTCRQLPPSTLYPHPASCQRRHQAPPTLHTGPDLPPPADPISATQATTGLANCCPSRAGAGPGHTRIGSSHALKAPQGARGGRRPSRLLHP